MSDNVTLRTVNLTKIYKMKGENVVALNNVNLTIERGEFLAIFGPSGSGKSTLLNMLGALDRPTSGKVYLDGKDISKMSSYELSKIRREKIGFVFQAFNLVPTLTALENVMSPLLPLKGRIPWLKKRAIELLESVGLGDRLHHRPTELSGGQKQRVAIARALINNPSIILADEPTGNVDTKTGDEIISLMRKLNEERGQTFVIVSHNPDVASKVDRIVRLKDGMIVEDKRIR